jgi:hypothetical protein
MGSHCCSCLHPALDHKSDTIVWQTLLRMTRIFHAIEHGHSFAMFENTSVVGVCDISDNDDPSRCELWGEQNREEWVV